MSVTSRFPYALIQQLQKDVESLSRLVTDLQNQNTAAADSALIVSLQNTIHSVCAVLSSTETETDNVFMHPTFTDCTVGVLKYLDDEGIPHDLETELDTKLTVTDKVVPCYYSNTRNISLDCSETNKACVSFRSNDTSTLNNAYDCKIAAVGGVSSLPGKGDLIVYNNATHFYGDVVLDENNLSCKTLTLNGENLTSVYYTKTASDDRYYTKRTSDDLYYNKTDSDNRYYTKTQSDDNYYTKTQSDTNYYTKTQSDTNYAGKATTEASLTGLEGEIAGLSDMLVDLGLVTGGVGTYSLFSSVVLGGGVSAEFSRCMKLSGEQTLTGSITFTHNNHTFAGATPTEIGHLSGVSANIQTQLSSKASLTSPVFAGTPTLNGQTLATVNQIPSLTAYAPLDNPAFTGTASLGGQTLATVNQIPSLTTYAPLANPAFTGTATLGGQTLATVNQIPSLTAYAPLANPAFTGTATLGGQTLATVNQLPSLTSYAPLNNPAFTGTATLGGQTLATVNQLPSLTSYAPLANPAFTGAATLGGQTLATINQLPNLTGYLRQATTLTPVYYTDARRIQMGVDYYNAAYINFHSTTQGLSSYLADYSSRIVSSGGSTNTSGQGYLNYYAVGHIFYGSISIGSDTVVTTNQLPNMSLYATLAAPNFSGTPTVANREILTQNTSVIPAYYNLGRYIELDVMTSNTANLDFHSYDNNSSMAVNYDGRIQCTGGNGSVGSGILSHWAEEHHFYGQISMTIGTTYSFVATIRDMENYAVPIDGALFTSIPQVYMNGGITNMALVSDIPSLTGYAKLASPAFTGTATLGGQTIATVNQIPVVTGYAPLANAALTGSPTVNGGYILGRGTTISPAYYGAGRYIEMDVSSANTARLDFHSFDTSTTTDYDGRIVCTGGVLNTSGSGSLTYTATTHTFNGTVKIGTLTVATTDLIPSLSGYATLASPQFTGNATVSGLGILTKDVTTTPAYYSIGRYIELGVSLANYAGLEFHSNDANTVAVNFDTRIYSSGGTAGSYGQGALYYAAKTHNFDNTIKIGTKTVATTDIVTGYVTATSLTTTLTGYVPTTGATLTGVLTFANTMSLGTTTTGSRIILYPGSTTTDWYGLGMAASKLVYNTPAAANHVFQTEGVTKLTISQTTTTLANDLALTSCLTINHPDSSTIPSMITHIGYNAVIKTTLNSAFGGTGVKNCATITLPALGVWMVTGRVQIQTSVPNTTQYWNDHSVGLSTSASSFNTNYPATINSVYYASGSTGLGLVTLFTLETMRIFPVTSLVSPSANLYLNTQVTTIAVGSPTVTYITYTYTRIA